MHALLGLCKVQEKRGQRIPIMICTITFYRGQSGLSNSLICSPLVSTDLYFHACSFGRLTHICRLCPTISSAMQPPAPGHWDTYPIRKIHSSQTAICYLLVVKLLKGSPWNRLGPAAGDAAGEATVLSKPIMCNVKCRPIKMRGFQTTR